MVKKTFPILAVDEPRAAISLGVSASTMRRWRRHGKGPRAIKLGRLVRYRQEDLRHFLRRSNETTTNLAPIPDPSPKKPSRT
jgi:predicted site-specific integrase-resolvase